MTRVEATEDTKEKVALLERAQGLASRRSEMFAQLTELEDKRQQAENGRMRNRIAALTAGAKVNYPEELLQKLLEEGKAE